MAEKIKKSAELILVLIVIISGLFGIAYSIEAYPKIFQVSVSLEKNSEVKPNEPVVVNFSEPALAESYKDGGVSVFPPAEVVLGWTDKNKKLVIYPKDSWKPETKYNIIFAAGRSVMLTKIEKTDIAFSAISYPKVDAFYPENGTKDVIVDIEDPIKISFAEPVEDFSLKFYINGENSLAYNFKAGDKSISLMPKTGIKPGEKYEVKVYAAYAGNKNKTAAGDLDGYEEIYASSFETLAPPPNEWEKDHGLRLEQAKKYTRAKIFSGKYIDINLAAQVMSIFENGKIIDSFLVSSGKRGMDTPKGEFKIYNKTPRAWSKTYGLYMPYWNAIVPGGKFGIHELPEWPGGYKEGANHLGIPVSHGCVRLGVGPAKIVYDFAEIGTPVVIY